MSDGWSWDETLYQGSAEHYAVGRTAYPPELAIALRDELGLDGTGRLLDVGCGPGSLTRLLAPHFASAIGVDADPGMIAVARAAAPEIEFLTSRAESLTEDLGTFDCVTFAQSFHWMDQPLVARRVREMLNPGGKWVHIFAQTHRGAETDVPWQSIEKLVKDYLGTTRRAGRGILPNPRSGEEDVLRAAGYRGPERVEIPWGATITRTSEEVAAAVFSLSWAAPHLFGDRLNDFERDLRDVLGGAIYTDRMREIAAIIWSP